MCGIISCVKAERGRERPKLSHIIFDKKSYDFLCDFNRDYNHHDINRRTMADGYALSVNSYMSEMQH